jgi:hypothetical protein
MSYASITQGKRTQRKSRRRSILLDYIQNMDTIVEENINEVNWNSFVDPRTEQRFDRKVKQRYMSNWEHEQDVFDDELLKTMFHWNPDHYCKLPNKNRKNRHRNYSSRSDSTCYEYIIYDNSFDKSFGYNNLQNSQNSQNYHNIQNNLYQNETHLVQNYNQIEYQAHHGKISFQDSNTHQLDSIKQFGPPPGLSKPQNSKIIETPSNNFASDNFSSKNVASSNFSDSASDSEIRTIPLSDEELLKDRSAIFATDFSSDSNFSDNYNSDSDFGNDNTASNNYEEQISGFKLNPTAQVFQPRFS